MRDHIFNRVLQRVEQTMLESLVAPLRLELNVEFLVAEHPDTEPVSRLELFECLPHKFDDALIL